MRIRRGPPLVLGAAIVLALGLLATAAVLALRWVESTDTVSSDSVSSGTRSSGTDRSDSDGSGTGSDGGAGSDGRAGPTTGDDERADGTDAVESDDELSPDVPAGADPAEAVAGELVWDEVGPGFETAELPVVLDGVEVDRILLARLDPSRHRFEVRTRPEGDWNVTDWLDDTGAALVVNGSYYDPDNQPVAPLITDSRPGGPSTYQASHGAFVATTVDGAETADVVDLIDTPWVDALAGAHDALVSYPMLIGDDGASRTDHVDPTEWANRTVIGRDTAGRIVIGATIQGFFSLDRIGPFLAAAPLDLETALNLDGGRLSCLAVRLPDQQREFCGQLDTSRRDGRLVVPDPDPTDLRPGLPIVLLVHPVGG